MSRNDLVIGFLAVAGLFALSPAASRAAEAEAGPEQGGLRLRLTVTPLAEKGPEGFDVRIDLANVSQGPITLKANWENDETGSVQDYLEAAASIETFPPIAPWMGGTAARPFESPQPPQPTHVLKGGETLSVRWKTSARRLKNRVSNPHAAQNPTFPVPGLYSVHASLAVITDAGTIPLRSNEQLVPVGGSRAMPRHTYGALSSVNAKERTATLGLGSLHRVAVGDQFGMPSKQARWVLTITEVGERYSEGKLERHDAETQGGEPHLPRSHAPAILEEKAARQE